MIEYMIFPRHALALAIVLLLQTGPRLELMGADQPAALETRVRQPVALGLANDGRLLLAANRRSGTISVVDTRTLRLLPEIAAGRGLSDLIITPHQERILVCDEPAGELISLHRQEDRFDVAHRLPVGGSPVSVQVDENGLGL